MKKILSLSLAILSLCMLYSCQRYPYLSYYIKVVDQAGNNVLDTVSGPGKTNVNDLWFEAITGDFRDTMRVVAADEIDSVAVASQDTPPANYPFPYEVKFNNYDRPHLWVSTSVAIGTELAECPVFVIHWADSTTDSLQIDNAPGTLSDPRYYVNGKQVKTKDQFITLKK